MAAYATAERCWCGTENPYFAPIPAGETCGGTGSINCYCGGDQCVCHWHEEIECEGCDDCNEHTDSDGDYW